ncbi:MAG: DUF2093 domain-containing protein [Pseudomonadota bacterium]
MMNRMEKPRAGGEAKISYLDGDFQVVVPGAYVRCAVTGRIIQLEDLRYWSVARQEPYVDAAAALERYRQLGNA